MRELKLRHPHALAALVPLRHLSLGPPEPLARRGQRHSVPGAQPPQAGAAQSQSFPQEFESRFRGEAGCRFVGPEAPPGLGAGASLRKRIHSSFITMNYIYISH